MIAKLREAGCDAYIIILTAYDSFAYAQKAISIGVKEYLLKPIDYDELKNMAEKKLNDITTLCDNINKQMKA